MTGQASDREEWQPHIRNKARREQIAKRFKDPKATFDQEEAVAVMREKHEVVCDMLHGFDHGAVVRGPAAGRMAGVAAAMDFILGLDDGKKRYLQAATELSKAFALSVPHEAALAIRDQVGFFQAIRAGLVKLGGGGGGGGGPGGDEPPEDLDTAIRQIVSKAVASDRVVDIFAAAGLQKPDISILSDEFLAEVKELPHRNLALELLRKLLNDEIKVCSARNIVQGRSFAQMLEESIRKYQNRSIETAEVIAELVNLAKDMREAHKRGEELGLSDDEIARASIRVIVRRILRRYGYPPDKQEQATLLVLEQAEVLCRDWAA
jgi:type I restriction enzyme R subunit